MASTSRNAFKIEHSETSENKEPKAVWNFVAVFSSPESQVSDPAKVMAKKMLQLEGGAVNG